MNSEKGDPMDEKRMAVFLNDIAPDGFDEGLAFEVARSVMRRPPGQALLDALFVTGPDMLGAILREVSAHTEHQTYRAATAILQPLGEEMYSRVRDEFDAVSDLMEDIRQSTNLDVVIHRRAPGASGDLLLEIAINGYYVGERPILHLEAKTEMNQRWITPVVCNSNLRSASTGPYARSWMPYARSWIVSDGRPLGECVDPVRSFWHYIYVWLDRSRISHD